jgi:hypothetical protein
MEIMRGYVRLISPAITYSDMHCRGFCRLCSDAELMRHVWERYDAQGSGSNVFGSLISALKRLVTEKPALLGVGSQMGGVGVSGEHLTSTSVLDVGGMAGRVATAASATVSGVVGMIGGGGGLSLHGSAMKLQWYVA